MSCDPLYTVPIVKITSRVIVVPGRSPGNVHSSIPPPNSVGMNIPSLHFTTLSPISAPQVKSSSPIDALPQPSAQGRLTRLAGELTRFVSPPWAPLPFHNSPKAVRTLILKPSCTQPRQTLHYTPPQLFPQFQPDPGDGNTQGPSMSSGTAVFALTGIARQSTLLAVLTMHQKSCALSMECN